MQGNGIKEGNDQSQKGNNHPIIGGSGLRPIPKFSDSDVLSFALAKKMKHYKSNLQRFRE